MARVVQLSFDTSLLELLLGVSTGENPGEYMYHFTLPVGVESCENLFIGGGLYL